MMQRLGFLRLLQVIRDATLPHNTVAADKVYEASELLALVNDEAVVRAILAGFLVGLSEVASDLCDELRLHLESRGWTKAEIASRRRS